MKSTGVTRRLDDLGRVVIPIELRQAKGFNENGWIGISIEENFVVLHSEANCYDFAKRLRAGGRLTIPKEIQSRLYWHPGTTVEFFEEDEKLYLRKFQTETELSNDVDSIAKKVIEIKNSGYISEHKKRILDEAEAALITAREKLIAAEIFI